MHKYLSHQSWLACDTINPISLPYASFTKHPLNIQNQYIPIIFHFHTVHYLAQTDLHLDSSTTRLFDRGTDIFTETDLFIDINILSNNSIYFFWTHWTEQRHERRDLRISHWYSVGGSRWTDRGGSQYPLKKPYHRIVFSFKPIPFEWWKDFVQLFLLCLEGGCCCDDF